MELGEGAVGALAAEVAVVAQESELASGLRRIGRDQRLRKRFVELCLETEAALAQPDVNVRDEVTGPLVDALYADVDTVSVTLNDGTSFEVPYRSKIARDLAMRTVEKPDHVFEPQTTKLLLYLSRNARHVVIGGAYSGDHALLVARRIAANGGVVHAFEPNSEQMGWLVRNAERNGITNIRFNEVALWERSDVRLKLVGDDAYIRTEPASGSDGLEVTTIDEYAKANGIEKIDAIMLDIEGGELPVLRGAASFLSRLPEFAPAVIFEINNAYVDWSQGLHATVVVELLREHGYESYGIRDYQSNVDMAGYPVELVPVEGAYIGGPRHGFNALGIKGGVARLRDPLFRIVPGVSPKLLKHRDPALHAPLNRP